MAAFAVGEIGKRRANQRRRFGDRLQLERDLRDNGERPLRADEQLAEVVAGHVLDDPSAGMEHLAVRFHGRQPDHVIAKRSQSKPPRSTGIRRQSATQRRAFPMRNIDRQPQPFASQYFIEPRDRNAGFDRDRHVTGRKLDDAIEPAGDDFHRSIGERRAVFKRGAASDWNDRTLGSAKVFHEKGATPPASRARTRCRIREAQGSSGGKWSFGAAHVSKPGIHVVSCDTPRVLTIAAPSLSKIGVEHFIVSIFA